MKNTLGWLALCLNVADLERSVAFYEKLDYVRIGGNVSVFQGMLDGNMLNFRGGDCFHIAEVLASRGIEIDSGPVTDAEGSDNLFVSDPDGNVVYFNTYPQERLY